MHMKNIKYIWKFISTTKNICIHEPKTLYLNNFLYWNKRRLIIKFVFVLWKLNQMLLKLYLDQKVAPYHTIYFLQTVIFLLIFINLQIDRYLPIYVLIFWERIQTFQFNTFLGGFQMYSICRFGIFHLANDICVIKIYL